MAQQDKTDWYWNGVLAGAVNNLYYDLINVDVVHTPYSTTYRNSSFFLQTRQNYSPSYKWERSTDTEHMDWDVVDVKYIWDDKCDKNEGHVYVLLADKGRNKIRIHEANIKDGCVQNFDWNKTNGRIYDVEGCGAFKLFTTDYVKGTRQSPGDVLYTVSGSGAIKANEGIQINRYEGGTTVGYFTDLNIQEGNERFMGPGEDEDRPGKGVSIGDYILVYPNPESPILDFGDEKGMPGQVRMITKVTGNELQVDSPWLGFKTLSADSDEDEIKKGGLSYYIFSDWGEVVGFTNGRNVYVVTNSEGNAFEKVSVYDQTGLTYTNIISIAEALGKIYILTDNGYIHYSNYFGYNKFFVQDDMYAGPDKIALASYRDIVLAFGNKHIAVGIPDENNTYTTMYNQSSTVGVRSRYSFAEYDGDLLFVSNDKRLLALGIASNTGKYMLQYEDVGDMINSKLSIMTAGDEVYLGNDNNDLRVFLQTKSKPYYNTDGDWQAGLTTDGQYKQENSMTRIIKFNKQFKVWTEDWIQGILLQGVEGGIYYGENGLYQRGRGDSDYKGDNYDVNGDSSGIGHKYPFKTYISAYLIENEGDWIGTSTSRLANRPKLYNLAKLNRLITTLGPGLYTNNSKIQITAYVKGLGSIYEFPISGSGNDWLGLISTKFEGEEFDTEDEAKLECMNSVIQDSQKVYQPKCEGVPNAAIQNLAQTQPWCDVYSELLVFDKGVCIDDSLYELAPTMPLTTRLGENQQYATQIKLELIGGIGDIITFGGWLGEMFIAPLFTVGPDGEYQLQPNTDC